MSIDEKFSVRGLTEFLLKNNIDNYELEADKNEVRISYIEDFNKLIPLLKVQAYRRDLGEFAPYGAKMNVWFECGGGGLLIQTYCIKNQIKSEGKEFIFSFSVRVVAIACFLVLQVAFLISRSPC